MLLCGFELLFLGFAGATAVGAKSIQALGQEGDSQPSYGEPPYGTPPQHLMPPPHRAQRMGREVRLHKHGKSFKANCSIENVRFPGVIDTGATACVIDFSIVRQLGEDPRKLRVTNHYTIANGGKMPATEVRLPFAVEGISMEDVEVAVVHVERAGALIGMSFLDRLSSYEARGNTLVLRP